MLDIVDLTNLMFVDILGYPLYISLSLKLVVSLIYLKFLMIDS